MAYHADFWILSGTVAPVLGLVQLVAITRYRPIARVVIRDRDSRVDTYRDRFRQFRAEADRQFDSLRESSREIGEQVKELREKFGDRAAVPPDIHAAVDNLGTRVAETTDSLTARATKVVAEMAALRDEVARTDSGLRISWGAELIAIASWILAVGTLFSALGSTSESKDVVPPIAILITLGVVIVLVLASVLIDDRIGLLFREAPSSSPDT